MIRCEDLPDGFRDPGGSEFSGPPPAATLAQSKENVERERITEALDRNGNNRLRAAAELGISRMTLYKKTSTREVWPDGPLPPCGIWRPGMIRRGSGRQSQAM